IDLFRNRQAVPDSAFLETTEPYQASWDEWARGYGDGGRGNIGGGGPQATPNVYVIRVRDRATTVAALERIARPGEGPDSKASRQNTPMDESHFSRFHAIYEKFPASNPPSRRVPTNPTTDANPDSDRTRITNPTSLMWAHLFNVRYRKLLYTLKHAFFVPAG